MKRRGAWITPTETEGRDDRGRPITHYVVSWYEIARDAEGRPIPRDSARPDGSPKRARRQETYSSAEAAQDRVDELNPKVARGLSPAEQRNAGNRPLNHYADAYFDGCEGNVKPGTLRGYRDNYRRYVAEPMGDRPVAAITAADVRRWRADLLKPRPVPAHARPKGVSDTEAAQVTLSRSTVKHAVETLRRILDVAVIDGALTANPCAALQRSRSTEAKAETGGNPLTDGQVAAVADHIARVQGYPLYGLVVMFAAYTGLRAAELAGLNVGDLLLPSSPGSAGSVRVDRQRKPKAGATGEAGGIAGWETSTLKTRKGYRSVPIDGWLADDLRAYLANDHPSAGDPNAPLFPGRYARAERLPSGLIRDEIEPARHVAVDADAPLKRGGGVDRRHSRPDPHADAIRVAPSNGYKWGTPVNLSSLAAHYFKPALSALGISPRRWHDLRHTFAAISLTNGEHYMQVSEWLGHESYVTTMTIYAAYIPTGSGKAAPTRRPQPMASNVTPLRRPS